MRRRRSRLAPVRGGEIEVEAELFVQDTPLGVSSGAERSARLDWSRSPHRPTNLRCAQSTARWDAALNQPLVFVDEATSPASAPRPFEGVATPPPPASMSTLPADAPLQRLLAKQ